LTYGLFLDFYNFGSIPARLKLLASLPLISGVPDKIHWFYESIRKTPFWTTNKKKILFITENSESDFKHSAYEFICRM